jgi:hypothetical protein
MRAPRSTSLPAQREAGRNALGRRWRRARHSRSVDARCAVRFRFLPYDRETASPCGGRTHPGEWRGFAS